MTQHAAGQGRAAAFAGNELVPRIISAVALAAIVLLGAVLGGWAAAIVCAVAMSIVHLEWANLTDHSPWPTAVFTVGLVLAIAMIGMGLGIGGLILIGLAIIFSALTFSPWRPIGVLYAAMLGAGFLFLRLTPDGLRAVLIVLTVVWATDTGAYICGRTIGGAKLFPAISPNKTWAGAIGGLIIAVVAGAIVTALLGLPIRLPLLAIMALLSVVSQGGDLFESWVKRVFGAKDSGNIVPGHGGLLDRVDGLAVAGGVAALIGFLHAGANVATGLILW